MARYLEGDSPAYIRRTDAISRERFVDLSARFAGVAAQVLAGNFQPQGPEEAEWADLVRSTPREKLEQLLSEPFSQVRVAGWEGLRAELKADFALSPVKLRALKGNSGGTYRHPVRTASRW